MKKILVVDDDDGLRSTIAADFRRRGYAVTEAPNGAAALDAVSLQTPDLIISDVRMPELDGIQLLDRLRSENSEIPVFMFITGFSELTIEDAYHKGAAAIFAKPFNRKVLFNAVEWALLPKEARWQNGAARRIATDFEMELTAGTDFVFFKGHLINLGHGGMFVGITGEIPRIGTAVEFRILMTAGLPTELGGTGVVRHAHLQAEPGRPTGCGVEFVKFNEHSLPEALRLIAALSPIPYIPSN